MISKAWKCGNCGHEEEEATDELQELTFTWLGPLTSKVSCPACGSYTIQRAYDESCRAGYFLTVTSRNVLQTKGANV